MTICCVFQLTDVESLNEVSSRMMSDTGLYLHRTSNMLNADEDEEGFQPALEDDDILVGEWGHLFIRLISSISQDN